MNTGCSHQLRHIDWSITEAPSVTRGSCLRCGADWTANTQSAVPKSELERIAEQARDSVIRTEGSCLPICESIVGMLLDAGVPATIVETKVQGDKHWVVVVNGEYVTDCSFEFLVVDASRDQFDESFDAIIFEQATGQLKESV